MPRLGSAVIDVLHGEIKLILVMLASTTILSAAVGQDSQQWQAVFLEEGQYAVVEQIRLHQAFRRS